MPRKRHNKGSENLRWYLKRLVEYQSAAASVSCNPPLQSLRAIIKDYYYRDKELELIREFVLKVHKGWDHISNTTLRHLLDQTKALVEKLYMQKRRREEGGHSKLGKVP